MNNLRCFAAAAVSAAAPKRARPTILIAEDSQDGREMMQVLLGAKGYEVIPAENGVKAIEKALIRFPELILLDLQLPDLDGFAVTKNLRRHPKLKNIPIVVISGHDPNEHRQLALDAGCTDYLVKPLDFQRLEEILKTHVPLG